MIKLEQTDLEVMPVEDKIQLIEQLWDSINDSDIGLTEHQKHELDLRLQKMKDGTAVYVSWEEAKARIKS